MKKLLFSLALVGAVIPSFAVNSVNWEILRNPVDGESGFPQTASGRQLFVDFNNDGIMDYFIIAGQAKAMPMERIPMLLRSRKTCMPKAKLLRCSLISIMMVISI